MPTQVSPSRIAPVAAIVLLLLVGALAPGHVPTRASKSKIASAAGHRREKGNRVPSVELASNPGPSGLRAYRDLGSWIDIYDAWPWAHPTLAVRKLDERGVQ